MAPTPVHRFSRTERFHFIMRLAAVSLCAAGLLAGCGSTDSSNLFATGRDARTFNPQTGRYEWPDNEPPRQPAKQRVSLRGNDSTAERKEAGPDDGRVFNPQNGRFERTDD